MPTLVILALGRRWVIRPLFSPHGSYLVDAVRAESPTVSTLVLRPRYRWQRGLRFAPCQFAWLRLDDAGQPGDHPFTIASNAHRTLDFRGGDRPASLVRRRPARQPGPSARRTAPPGRPDPRQRWLLLQNPTTQNVVLQTLLEQFSAAHLDGWRVSGQDSARRPGESAQTTARHLLA